MSNANFDAESVKITPVSADLTSPRQLIRAFLPSESSEDREGFYIIDLTKVEDQHKQWLRLLPRVKPFYAVKCNPDPVIVKLLAELGANFDCASMGELKHVQQFNVSSDRLLFANPCKSEAHLRYAEKHGVRMMTFDNEYELDKIKRLAPNAQAILRILVNDSYSVCKFGAKFGASEERVPTLLKHAQDLGVNVIGVSFHVGSGCLNALAFKEAVEAARRVFDASTQYGFKFDLLDLGGGFAGDDNVKVTFAQAAEVLRASLDEHFPESSGVRVIAEPGRYYVNSSHILATNITSKRAVRPQGNSTTLAENEPSFMYYVNDGTYGSLNCVMYDHAVLEPIPLDDSRESEPKFLSSFWGPTCDSLDCLTKTALVRELDLGEWVYFVNAGAYTRAAGSCFNGFLLPDAHYIRTVPKAE